MADVRKGELSVARCELCLARNGWARSTDNLKLAMINGRETLVCKRDNPLPEQRGNYDRKSEGI
jgi:hypothetical protein